MTDDEIEGRLAALEAIAAMGLRAEIRSYFAGSYSQEDRERSIATIANRTFVSAGAAPAFAAALERIFDKASDHPLLAPRP